MNQQTKEKIFGIVGLLFACGAIWLVWEIGVIFISSLREADAKITASVIGGITTVIVGLVAALYTQKQIKLREIDEAHRAKKVELYSGFLNIVQKLMAGDNKNIPIDPLDPNEMILFALKFKTEIILWSSPGVINAYREYEDVSSSGAEARLLPAVESLYREMRKDIGLSNRGLPANQLVKMYLKDPTELDVALLAVNSNKASKIKALE